METTLTARVPQLVMHKALLLWVPLPTMEFPFPVGLTRKLLAQQTRMYGKQLCESKPSLAGTHKRYAQGGARMMGNKCDSFSPSTQKFRLIPVIY